MGILELSKENTYDGSLILVSPGFALHKMPDEINMVPAIKKQDGVLLDKQAAFSLQKLLTDIDAGNEIVAVSGFRTQKEQENLWENSMEDHGIEFTRKFVAFPGHSEHQTGLAVDLGENRSTIDYIRPAFPYRGICDLFRKRAPMRGFIQRYPKGKEPVTGIGEEPWHFRYVGFPHSVIMAKRALTLEEYISFLKRTADMDKPYVFFQGNTHIDIFYISVKKRLKIHIPENTPHHISGTNEGGVVISLWRNKHD